MRASAKLLPWPPSQTLTLTLTLILTLTLTLTLILTLALALTLTLALTQARILTLTPTLTWSAAAGASGAEGGSAAPPPSQAFLAGAAAGAGSGSPPTEGAREARLEVAYWAEARLEAYFEMEPPVRVSVRVRGRVRVRVRVRISPHAPLALISPRLPPMVAFPLPPLVLTRGARGGLADDGLDAQPHHLAARVELDLLGRVRVRG